MESDQTNGFDAVSFPAILEGIPLAVSVVDLNGTLLYFNPYAARILDRKPAYLGTDIRGCHADAASNDKIDRLLDEFAEGQRSSFSYRAHRYGRLLDVMFTPLVSDNKVVGVIQTAMEVKQDDPSALPDSG